MNVEGMWFKETLQERSHNERLSWLTTKVKLCNVTKRSEGLDAHKVQGKLSTATFLAHKGEAR
jgi:hypothetical protein